MAETHVRTHQELVAASGSLVVAHGRYMAQARPIRGTVSPPGPADRAVLVLDEGVEVWLEPLDDPGSVRPYEERRRFEGMAVRVHGVAHEVMPGTGEGLLEPCLSGVHDLEEEEA